METKERGKKMKKTKKVIMVVGILLTLVLTTTLSGCVESNRGSSEIEHIEVTDIVTSVHYVYCDMFNDEYRECVIEFEEHDSLKCFVNNRTYDFLKENIGNCTYIDFGWRLCGKSHQLTSIDVDGVGTCQYEVISKFNYSLHTDLDVFNLKYNYATIYYSTATGDKTSRVCEKEICKLQPLVGKDVIITLGCIRDNYVSMRELI